MSRNGHGAEEASHDTPLRGAKLPVNKDVAGMSNTAVLPCMVPVHSVHPHVPPPPLPALLMVLHSLFQLQVQMTPT